jgi:hypothetical protein
MHKRLQTLVDGFSDTLPKPLSVKSERSVRSGRTREALLAVRF